MPLDDRLREGLREEAWLVDPDTERRLREVRRRAGAGPSVGPWLVAVATVALVITALVIGLVPGGGPSPDPTPTPGATSRPNPSGFQDALIGSTWTVTLLPTDPDVADLGMAGAWAMRLHDDSVVEIVAPDSFQTSEGSGSSSDVYAIVEDAFFTNLFATDYGSSCANSGSYQTVLEQGRLTFSGRDTCQARHVLLATRPWTRTP